jgi:hypothetical protein
MPTLQELEHDNLEAVLRGEPAALYALYQWARRSKEGLSEAEFSEARAVAARELDERQTKGALTAMREAQQVQPKQATPERGSPPAAPPTPANTGGTGLVGDGTGDGNRDGGPGPSTSSPASRATGTTGKPPHL